MTRDENENIALLVFYPLSCCACIDCSTPASSHVKAVCLVPMYVKLSRTLPCKRDYNSTPTRRAKYKRCRRASMPFKRLSSPSHACCISDASSWRPCTCTGCCMVFCLIAATLSFSCPHGPAVQVPPHLHPVDVLLEAPLSGQHGKRSVQNMESRMDRQNSAGENVPAQIVRLQLVQHSRAFHIWVQSASAHFYGPCSGNGSAVAHRMGLAKASSAKSASSLPK